MPPTTLLNSLESVRRRVKVLGVVYGIGIVVAIGVALLLATILVDYVMNLYPTPRLVVVLVALAISIYSAARWIVKPMLARLSVNDVAGRLEQAFPEFDDRLRSTVDFVNADIPGSDMMKQRVVGEASELAGRLDLGRAVVAKPAWQAVGVGLCSMAILVGLAWMSPHYASIALARLLTPFNGDAWPKRVQIEVAGELPTRVPVGQRVEVKMKLTRGDSTSRQAKIIYQYDDGPEQKELMIRGADGTYAASLDARVDSGKPGAQLKIRMQAGDDEKIIEPISVVPRMAIKSVEAELTPPPYVTNQKPANVNLATAPAMVADGSTVKVKVSFTKPLATSSVAELVPSAPEMPKPEVAWLAETPSSANGAWVARKSLRFHIRATDMDGFSNNALEEYELIVRPDQNPAVQIESPRRNEERTADALVPLTVLAEDDYGVASLKLMVERYGNEKQKWEIGLMENNVATSGATATRAEGSSDRLRFRVNYQWELAQLKDANLKSGDILEYYMVVRDNFELDGQKHPDIASGHLRITIVTPDELAAHVLDDLRQIRGQIQRVREGVDRTRAETRDVADETRAREQLDPADRAALERLTNQQATSTSQTMQLAGRVNQIRDRLTENRMQNPELNDITRDVANDLQQAAQNPMREATNQLSQANRQNGNQNQNQQRNPSNNGQQPQNDAGQQQNQQQSAENQQQQNGQQQNGQQQNGQQQASQQQSGQQQNGQQQSGQQQTGQQQASQQQSGQQQSGQQQNGQQQSGQQQSGQQQASQQQSGQQQQQSNQPQQTPEQRNQALARAVEQQQQASEQLQRAVDRMNGIGSMQETLARLRQLLEQQQQVSRQTRDAGRNNIGQNPDQMKPEDRQRLNDIANQQQRLAEQTQQSMQDMQRQAEQMQRSDQTSANAMRRAAQTGQQQQTSQNQQRASQQTRQNQQAQAQQAQRQAELGLQLMVDQLREAEQHKLAELQKQLEEMAQQVAGLIRRQAGHNLDNLAVQGPEKLAALDEAVRKGLFEKAERDPADQQAMQASQLSPPQEQTERNTRDLAKSAEDMSAGAETANQLTRAAGRMERAIVNLRDRKLSEAYDPSQIDALAALEAAAKIVDQQREQVDQQVQDQQKEAVRQRFVKIRAEQQKLNDETARIDGARGADGALGRADAVRLGQLPGEQGKLADSVTSINEDLTSADSTVYVWANRDIAESMGDVKQDLGKGETGVTTRSEQVRIVEQLDAMIKNMAVNRRRSPFAQDQGGQGQQGQQQGQGQRQRLPTEAELRLLQDLQRAVNKNTIVLDQQPEKDKPRLTALGNRQGDLRGVLDQLLQKSSRGQLKLGPEPDSSKQLPEEAGNEQIENQELDKELLQGAPDADKDEKQANLIGDRMARSRQRLAMNTDPGRVTQLIQQRIIIDLDALIQQAREQEAQTRNARQQQQQRQQGQQRMAQGQQRGQQAQNQGQQQQQQAGQNSAVASRSPGQSAVNTDLSRDIHETDREWGQVSQRVRKEAIDSKDETIIEPYRRFIEDYYRSVSNKGAGQ